MSVPHVDSLVMHCRSSIPLWICRAGLEVNGERIGSQYVRRVVCGQDMSAGGWAVGCP